MSTVQFGINDKQTITNNASNEYVSFSESIIKKNIWLRVRNSQLLFLEYRRLNDETNISFSHGSEYVKITLEILNFEFIYDFCFKFFKDRFVMVETKILHCWQKRENKRIIIPFHCNFFINIVLKNNVFNVIKW